MKKFFDLKTHSIKRLKEKNDNVAVIRVAFHSEALDMPLSEMMEGLKLALANKISDTTNKIVYYDIMLTGKCSKEDVEDFYDYVENALTDIYCKNYEENKKAEEQDRLGLFGLPDLNLKTINYLRWIKFNTEIAGIGFEVSKINSCWNKRLIK